MCLSLRGTIFFLGTLHLYFGVTQMIRLVPRAMASLSNLESVMALIFTLFYFSAGFLTFRGADEESDVLVRLGGIVLSLILVQRTILGWFSVSLPPSLPEGDFLADYGSVFPITFTALLYTAYLAFLFAYHKQLNHTPSNPHSYP